MPHQAQELFYYSTLITQITTDFFDSIRDNPRNLRLLSNRTAAGPRKLGGVKQ